MKRRLKLAFLIACCVFAFNCTRDFKSNNLRFDGEKWKTGDLRERGQMTNDLLSQSYLQGKLPDEVRDILGKPDIINRNGNFEYKTDPSSWFGGPKNGPWIHWLSVEFGKMDGRVVRVYIID